MMHIAKLRWKIFFPKSRLKNDNIDSITVRWPDGNIQSLYDVKDQINTTILIKKSGIITELIHQISMGPVFKTDETTIPYTHGEIAKNDFKLQPLIPDMISYSGPKIATGDINKDNFEDIYFCGSAGKAGVMMTQKENGTFAPQSQPDFSSDAKYEDTDATPVSYTHLDVYKRQVDRMGGDKFLTKMWWDGGN